MPTAESVRTRSRTGKSSIFYAFGEDDEDDLDEERARMSAPRSRARMETNASCKSRACSLPGDYMGNLSATYSVNDVARRSTLAAQALGVSKSAHRRTVAGAFYKGARKHHPDKGGDKEDFQVLREAYARLLLER
jgi:hypothetical protein